MNSPPYMWRRPTNSLQGHSSTRLSNTRFPASALIRWSIIKVSSEGSIRLFLSRSSFNVCVWFLKWDLAEDQLNINTFLGRWRKQGTAELQAARTGCTIFLIYLDLLSEDRMPCEVILCKIKSYVYYSQGISFFQPTCPPQYSKAKWIRNNLNRSYRKTLDSYPFHHTYDTILQNLFTLDFC